MSGKSASRAATAAWSKEKAAAFERGLGESVQLLLAMVNSEHFPDWAREEIGTHLDKEALTLRGLVDIMEEAQEDMLDQKALAEEPEDQQTFSLPQVERHFARHAEL